MLFLISSHIVNKIVSSPSEGAIGELKQNDSLLWWYNLMEDISKKKLIFLIKKWGVGGSGLF